MIAVGRVVGSVGLKGWVRIETFSEQDDRIAALREIFVGEDQSSVVRSVVEASERRGAKSVMKIEGIDERSAADRLKGAWIFVEDDAAVPVPQGTYFVHDIIGLRAENEEGTDLGTFADVVSLPGGDAWVLKTGDHEVMIPAVKEFIRHVDLERKRVVIHAIEGLLE